jgi:hypothetical protein
VCCRLERSCTRQHACGHHCGGVRGETHCLPCLEVASLAPLCQSRNICRLPSSKFCEGSQHICNSSWDPVHVRASYRLDCAGELFLSCFFWRPAERFLVTVGGSPALPVMPPALCPSSQDPCRVQPGRPLPSGELPHAGDECSICWVEPLRQAPAVRCKLLQAGFNCSRNRNVE